MNNRAIAPLVSVIISTLNRGKYLRQCIESALSQDYPNFEIIVVDNGSTDSTPEILSSFGDKIRCLKEEKRGVSAVRNKGLRAAEGEFIAFLDDDDFYLPGKISLSARKMLEDHSVSLVYTDYVLVDSESRRIQTVKKIIHNRRNSSRLFWTITPSRRQPRCYKKNAWKRAAILMKRYSMPKTPNCGLEC